MSQYDTLEQKAVALKYDETQNSAPVIVASGMGYVAEKIVEIANDNGIPVYEDNSLATVLAQMKLGKEIPPELYQTIVDIYAYFLRYVPKHADETQEAIREETTAEEAHSEEVKKNNRIRIKRGTALCKRCVGRMSLFFLCRFTGITDGGEIYSGSDFP